jgi:KUP system potassium uptake protein
MRHDTSSANRNSFAAITLTALGVVYGDIGTSPLYTLRECLNAHHLPPTEANVLGILSLIFWTVFFVVTLKYVLVVMRADNDGEGGILALLAKTLQSKDRSGRSRWALTMVGLFGAALFYGDGIITPAISVLSAVEGLEVATPMFRPYVVPIALLILLGLFLIQRHGTEAVGKFFGPIMVLWFICLALTGLYYIASYPRVLLAVNPWYIWQFVHAHPYGAFLTLGAVVLAVTGGEALYADMGHFGQRPIRWAWFGFVMPALLVNYFGQNALVINQPESLENPFFHQYSGWLQIVMVLLATLATIIASQAVISGAYSLTHQALQLGFLPRTSVQHTSAHERGQIYLPAINWALLLGVIVLVLIFRSSSNLASAYGIAVTGTMLMTTVLFYFVSRNAWHWSLAMALAVTAIFFSIDLLFLAANAMKIPDGGWFPLAIGLGLFTVMTTWRMGRILLFRKLAPTRIALDDFLGGLGLNPPQRVPGTGVFLAAPGEGVPLALLNNYKHNKVLHERVIILTMTVAERPRVPFKERYSVSKHPQNFYHVRAEVGFMEFPAVPRLLSDCKAIKPACKPEETSYFVSRLRVIASDAPGMAIWRERLFALMAQNAAHATDFFEIPPSRVLELDLRVYI